MDESQAFQAFPCRSGRREDSSAYLSYVRKFRGELTAKVISGGPVLALEFHSKFHTELSKNFKKVRPQKFSAFVYFIVFNIDNIDEIQGLELFEGTFDSEADYTYHRISCKGSMEGYYREIVAALEEEGEDHGRSARKHVLCFEGKAAFREEELEYLVRMAAERLHLSDQLACVFFTMETNRYSLCSSSLHVTELAYSSTQELKFEALYRFVKACRLPYPVISPGHLALLFNALQSYSLSFQTNALKWIASIELFLVRGKETIQADLTRLSTDPRVPGLSRRFAMGLKLLHFLVQLAYPSDALADQKTLEKLVGEVSVASLVDALAAVDARDAPAGRVDSFFEKAREFLQKSKKYAPVIAADPQLRDLVSQFLEPPSLAPAPEPSRPVPLRGRRGEAILQALKPAPSLQNLSGSARLDRILSLCIGGYYLFVKEHYRSLYVEPDLLLESFFNPDLRGELLRGLRENPKDGSHIHQCLRLFFEKLGTMPIRFPAAQLFDELAEPFKSLEPKNKDSKPLFLYCLSVFEHIGFLRLDRATSNIERFVFQKYL